MEMKHKKATLWTVPFISIFIVNFSLQMGQYMMNLLVPKYADYLGGNAFIVGVVGSMFALTALAIRPLSGPAINCLNKKRLMAVTSGIIVIAFLIYGFAESLPLLIIGRLIHGIGIGVTSPLALAIVGECVPEERMGSGIGIFTMGQAVATAIGPSIGLSLVRSIGYSYAFLIGGAVVAFACALTFMLPNEPKKDIPFQIRMDTIFAKESFAPALIMMSLAISYSCINSYMAIYGEARGVEQIGLFFTAYAVALVLSRPVSGAIADKRGDAAALIPGFILFAIAYLLISYANTLWLFLIAGIVSAFGYGTITPNTQSIGMRRVPAERRGVAANTMYTGMDVGFLLGGPIAGFVCQEMQSVTGSNVGGYSAMFQIMIIPIAFGAAVFLWDWRRHRTGKAAQIETDGSVETAP